MGYTDLTVSAYDSLGVTVQLKGYSPSAKEFVASQKKINWRKTDEGWFLFSDWTVIDTFIAFLKEHGNAKVASRADRLPLLQNNEEAQRELERPLCRICVDYHGDMGKELFLSINTRDNEPVSYLYKHAKTLHNIDTKVEGNKVYFTCSEHSLGVLKSLSRQDFSKHYVPFFSQALKDRICNISKMEVVEVEEKKEDFPKFPLINVDNIELPFEPYPFQIEDAARLLEDNRMLIGHDMGAGKTFIATLVGTSIPMPKLVICPESLRLNWRKEIYMVDKDADVHILYSNKPFEIGTEKNSWNIIGYSTMTKYSKELLNAKIPVTFIDEAHNCKSIDVMGRAGSKRAEVALKIADNSLFMYPMTGTPIPTSNKDLFNILKMLKVSKATKSFYHYGQKFCNGHDNGFGWDISGNSNSEELHNILAPHMIRRLKRDVLPNLTKQRIFLPMRTDSAKIQKECEKLIEEISQADMDNFLGYAMNTRRLLSGIKVKPCIDLATNLLNSGQSVVIVSEFIDTINAIKEKFKDDCCCIRGGMSDTAKQKAVDDFQNGVKRVCAVNMVAGGVGITLTKAHNMIICDFDWTPANMSQVEDRICRGGQTQECTIYYLYAEDMLIDDVFVRLLTSKNENIDRVVDRQSNSMDLKASLEKESKSFFDLLKAEVRNSIKERALERRRQNNE